MAKKCSVVEGGALCGKTSRCGSGLCYKHGGGRCRVTGCAKPARRAGRLCLDHVAEDAAAQGHEVVGEGHAEPTNCLECHEVLVSYRCHQCSAMLYCDACARAAKRKALNVFCKDPGSPRLPPCPACNVPTAFKKVQRKKQENTGDFVGKRAATKERQAAVSGLTAHQLLSAGKMFVESYRMDDSLRKAEVLRYLEAMLAKESGNVDEDIATHVKHGWCHKVNEGEMEAWQVLQQSLSACEDYPKRLPSWAKKPVQGAPDDDAKQASESKRVFNVLASYDVSRLQKPLADLLGDDVPQFFTDEWNLRTKRGDQPEERPVPLPVRLCAESCPRWVFLRAAYRCYQSRVHAAPGGYPTWARPPKCEDKREALADSEHDEADEVEALPLPEFAGCFDDAEVVSFASPGTIAGHAMDTDAGVARIESLVACLDDGERGVLCDRLEAKGLPLDDEGIEIVSLSPEQLFVLSQEVDKAVQGKPAVRSSQPLFRWPPESTKILDDNAEPADPPAKRARTSEDESHALLGVPFCDEGLSMELGADIASEMEKELLADGAEEPDADEEAEAEVLRELTDWLKD